MVNLMHYSNELIHCQNYILIAIGRLKVVLENYYEIINIKIKNKKNWEKVESGCYH